MLVLALVIGSAALVLTFLTYRSGRGQEAPATSAALPSSAAAESFDTHAVPVEDLLVESGVCEASESFRLSTSSATPITTPFGALAAQAEEPLVYGDLDGDGIDEVAVKLVCSFAESGRAAEQGFLLFAHRNTSMRQLAFLTTQRWQDRTRRGVVTEIAFEYEKVVVTEMHFRVRDAECCPSTTTTVDWYYRDGRLVPQRT